MACRAFAAIWISCCCCCCFVAWRNELQQLQQLSRSQRRSSPGRRRCGGTDCRCRLPETRLIRQPPRSRRRASALLRLLLLLLLLPLLLLIPLGPPHCMYLEWIGRQAGGCCCCRCRRRCLRFPPLHEYLLASPYPSYSRHRHNRHRNRHHLCRLPGLDFPADVASSCSASSRPSSSCCWRWSASYPWWTNNNK